MKSVFKEYESWEEMSSYISKFSQDSFPFFNLNSLNYFNKLKCSFIPKVLRPCTLKLFNYR